MSGARIDVLVVGAGLAGARLPETLRSAGFDGSVLVAGDEPHAPYERPAPSEERLVGEPGAAELALRPATPVAWVNLDERTARFDGSVARWRKPVVATGARAREIPGIPALPGCIASDARRRDVVAAGAPTRRPTRDPRRGSAGHGPAVLLVGPFVWRLQMSSTRCRTTQWR